MAKRREIRWLLVVCGLLATSSCRSVYEGEKLDTDGNLSGAEGIPFVLRRPEYSLVRDTSGRTPSYTLKVNYVPDPAQRYTLRLSPALTSAIAFNMELGEDGELTSATSKLTDQIVPTGQAVLSFAATLVGTAARAAIGGAPFAADALAPFKNCLDQPTDARASYCAIGAASDERLCDDGASDALQSRIVTHFFEPKGKLDSAMAQPDRGNIFGMLHYRNVAEKTCLEAAADEMNNIAVATEKSLTQQIDRLPEGEAKGEATKAFKSTVRKLIKSGDTTGARRLVQAIKEARHRGDQFDRFLLLRREVGKGITPSEEELGSWQGKLTDMGIWAEEGLAGATIEGLARARRVGTGLEAIADLDTDKWRGRHIAFLDSEIEARSLALLTQKAISDPRRDREVRRWIKEISITAEKGPQMERLLRLEAALDNLPPPQPSVHISAFEEYGRLRTEADRLSTEIAAAAETLVAASRSTPKAATGPLPLSVARASAACVAQSSQMGTDWFYGKGAIAPEFVIVLERPDGVAVDAPANEEFCP